MAIFQRNGEILAKSIEIKKVFFYLLSLVTQGEIELVLSITGVVFHDMPENGLAANLDKRFGTHFGILCQPGAHPPAEDNDGDVGFFIFFGHFFIYGGHHLNLILTLAQDHS